MANGSGGYVPGGGTPGQVLIKKSVIPGDSEWQNPPSGANGKSAYELAVEDGFQGSLQEWLGSLRGTNGLNGKDAYAIAKDDGFEGSIEEWLDSLRVKSQHKLRQITLHIPGAFAANLTQNALKDVGRDYSSWECEPLAVKSIWARCVSADTGAEGPRIRLIVNGTAVGPEIDVSASDWTTAMPSNVRIEKGQDIEIEVTRTGTDKNATDLHVLICGEIAILAESLVLDPVQLTIGTTRTRKVSTTIAPENANVRDIAWSSNRDDIAKVDVSGRITGMSIGDAVITASMNEGALTKTVDVTVVQDVPVTAVVLDVHTASITVNETKQLHANVRPDGAVDTRVEWGSSNPNIATVSSLGVVTGVAAGNAVITVRTCDGWKRDSCAVTVS